MGRNEQSQTQGVETKGNKEPDDQSKGAKPVQDVNANKGAVKRYYNRTPATKEKGPGSGLTWGQNVKPDTVWYPNP
jgi:hypothetical protein